MAAGVARPRRRAARDPRPLQALDGVGPRMAADLARLGVGDVAALARQDPLRLYRRLCELTGTRQDPCVLDVFRCAVAQARDPRLPAPQRRWWWWSRRRKAEEAGRVGAGRFPARTRRP